MRFELRTMDDAARCAFALACVLNAASWALILFNFSSASFPVIAHYNIFFGRDLLGEREMLFAAPLMGTLVLLINIYVYRLLKSSGSAFLQLLFAGTTVGLQIIVLLAARIAVLVNT